MVDGAARVCSDPAEADRDSKQERAGCTNGMLRCDSNRYEVSCSGGRRLPYSVGKEPVVDVRGRVGKDSGSR